MDMYKDKSYKSKYQSKDYPLNVELNDPLYVQYQVVSEKGNLNVFAEECHATPSKDEKDTPSYKFIQNG